MRVPTSAESHTPFSAFSHVDYRFYTLARLLVIAAYQISAVVIGQYVYEITKSPLHLGYIGLMLFLPKIIFTLFAGQLADRFDKRLIMLGCRVVLMGVSAAFVWLIYLKSQNLLLIYALLFLTGLSGTFEGPATTSLVPFMVSPKNLQNAVTWNSSTMQFALVLGPALGGWLYVLGQGALLAFIIVAIMRFISTILVMLIRTKTGRQQKENINITSLLAGLQFVWRDKIILGAISLDLFAVLFGGAVALMPVFANEILHVGPTGLGYLRSAPSFGAALMTFLLAIKPPIKNTGPIMLVCVAIFGVTTILFALSTNFYLSLIILSIMGAADMVSVVIRGTLVQLRTPDAMRGRVSAVNLVFIGASNELGEFESGITAALFGTIPAVIFGGVGTILVVLGWTKLFPELRKLGNMKS